ncbi:MAG: hypothetical protein Q8O16_05615 [Dehalococcoidia bacterium]|nr:hypothetical protein [Dehalococcoidia bacterium]
MKMTIGIVLGIICGIAVIIGGTIVAINYIGSSLAQKPIATPPPAGITTPAPKPPPATITAPIAPAPTTPAPALPPGAPPTMKVGIFEFTIKEMGGSGLSRTITAQITNTSTSDANNVQVKMEVFSQQQRIMLSGQDYLMEDLGTVKAKTSVTRQINISLSLADGMKVAQGGGARFVLTVSSDKGTETLNYDYKLQ